MFCPSVCASLSEKKGVDLMDWKVFCHVFIPSFKAAMSITLDMLLLGGSGLAAGPQDLPS